VRGWGIVFLFGGVSVAQQNPLAHDRNAIREGASLFRANCSPCHGMDGRGGGRGPDLAASSFVYGASDDGIFQIIGRGRPGTEMPGNAFEDSETWTLVSYLRSLNTAPLAVAATGDRRRGEGLFFDKEKCAQCHMVNGRGGHLGPDLSRVGAARSLKYLTESIREPSKELSLGYADPNNHYGIPLEYDTVIAVMRNGKRLVGVAKNEDAFTVQLLGEDDELHLLLKKDLSEVRHERRSLMPPYGADLLSEGELQDLLAYLAGLRGESH
jgi:putative heme-binding domain-containing protein